ncbi:MAG: PIG-L family deacetylase [Candidatus Omnitrophica bacterium]|nr:PIG-L family deacetylase [Candidatus Omnitrophota bacterium]MBU1997390.1 PIG-L family deacetylase [Candidatus Omnitrophota bacterium]
MKSKNILIIAAHPDDELLGCAGTVNKFIKNKYEATSLILGEGLGARGKASAGKLKTLKDHSKKANKIIGVNHVLFENLPDNMFDSVPLLKITKIVEKHILKLSPDIIFTHFENDLNIDHRLTFSAVMTACRPQPGFKHPDIYSFEIPSSTDYGDFSLKNAFVPNTYFDIKDEIELKLSALKEYKTEMRDYPHTRSIEGINLLAKYRGLKVGLEFAEAFQLVRKVSN